MTYYNINRASKKKIDHLEKVNNIGRSTEKYNRPTKKIKNLLQRIYNINRLIGKNN